MPQRKPTIPRFAVYAIVLSIPVALLPFALIARARAVKSSEPRLHFFQDMGAQPKLKAQATSTRYTDGRAMRQPLAGTVARGQLDNDDHFHRGKVFRDGKWTWASTYPADFPVTLQTLERGQERFNIYCATCHGDSGNGLGLVHRRAEKLQSTGWVQPSSMHLVDPATGKLTYGAELYPHGKMFQVITHGVRTMPGYESQIPTEDRWAIVAYIRALQLSQNAPMDAVPQEKRPALR